MSLLKIISLGGSIVIPKEGFDIQFLKRFKNLIIERVKKGERFILVIGGGATCRQYQRALGQAHGASKADLDWLGIHATHLNAHFIRLLFGKFAHAEIVVDPTKKIKTNKPIIVAGGWKPGCSTDRDAVWLAKTYGAKEVLNASNVDYVYTADPKIDKQAKPIEKMTWAELRKIVGSKWSPGANLPFDPLAAQEAQKLKLKVLFVKGTDLEELGRAIGQEQIRGTIIY
ncbi:UMP kinase [Patescibacteria group bacterium]|nr:MAG: UMP kinase [Patescibacteria group bacterium]